MGRVLEAACEDYGVRALQEVAGGLQGLLPPQRTPARDGAWRMSELGYFAYVRPRTGFRTVSLIPHRTAARPIDGWRVPAVLLAVTIATTAYAGWDFTAPAAPASADVGRRMIEALEMSAAVLFILLSHEFGHWFAARRNGIRATLPHVIPAPFLFGTLGAFIQLRSPPPDRDAMIKMGAAGPLAGMAAVIAVLGLSLPFSTVAPSDAHGTFLVFGEPLLLNAMTALLAPKVAPGQELAAHPGVLAGWFGLLITALNLLPVGQLDGGHVLRAYLSFRAHKRLTRAIAVLLLGLGWLSWSGWYLWAAVAFGFSFVGNPGPSDEAPPPSRTAHLMAGLTLIAFVLAFCPWPVTEVTR